MIKTLLKLLLPNNFTDGRLTNSLAKKIGRVDIPYWLAKIMGQSLVMCDRCGGSYANTKVSWLTIQYGTFKRKWQSKPTLGFYYRHTLFWECLK